MRTRRQGSGTIIRTDLTRDEYGEIRKLAIDRRQLVSKVTGDQLRKLLKQAKAA